MLLSLALAFLNLFLNSFFLLFSTSFLFLGLPLHSLLTAVLHFLKTVSFLIRFSLLLNEKV